MSLLRMSNFTQQIITSMKFIASNFFTRGDQLTLGRSKPKWSWQHLTTSLLLVLNNFINKRFTTKSREEISDLSSGQASKPYSKIGIHLMFVNCKVISSEAIRPILHVKQHSETVMVWNYQNADRSFNNTNLLWYLLLFSTHFRCLYSHRPPASIEVSPPPPISLARPAAESRPAGCVMILFLFFNF